MNSLVKKLHMYLGLLNCSILFVFGIAGLTATFRPAPENRRPPDSTARYESFTVPPGLTDKQAADRVYEHLSLPLTAPVPNFAMRRDRDNNLAFNFYTVNGIDRVTVLEKENRLRIDTTRNTIWQYFDGLHTTTLRVASPDWRLRLWGFYNELAIWSLIAMAVSGVYLWLSSRPRFRAAQYSFAAGSGAFVLLYLLTR